MPGPKLATDIHADASDLLQLAISFSNTGDNTIIAGIANQIIRVWKIFLIVSAGTNITYKDAATLISGALPFSANEGMVLDFDTKPWMTCASGDSFILNQSGSAQVSGTVYYTQGP